MATREELKQVFANGQMATGEKFANLIDSMKVVQLPVVDPQALGTSLSFIDSISQDADGKITPTKKTLDLANAHELNPFKGWWKTGDTLPTSGFDGAYLYFKDTTQTPAVTTIYQWNGTAYVDTGTEVDESNVQTFGSGQQVNAVNIKDGDGNIVSGPTSVLSEIPSNVLTEDDIVNDLITGGINKPLSAEQGKKVGGDLYELSQEVNVSNYYNCKLYKLTGVKLTSNGITTHSSYASYELFYFQAKANVTYTINFGNTSGTKKTALSNDIPAVGTSISNYNAVTLSSKVLTPSSDCYIIIAKDGQFGEGDPTATTIKNSGIGYTVKQLQQDVSVIASKTESIDEFTKEYLLYNCGFENDASQIADGSHQAYPAGTVIYGIVPNSKVSNLIPTVNVKKLVCSLLAYTQNTAYAIAYYDKDKVFISGLKSDSQAEQVIDSDDFPEGTYYMRVGSVFNSSYEPYAIFYSNKDLLETQNDIYFFKDDVDNGILKPLEIYWAACGDSITHANHSAMLDHQLKADDIYAPIDDYFGKSGFGNSRPGNYPNYAYYFCKRNRMQWANYGYGGTILGTYIPKYVGSSNYLYPFVADNRLKAFKSGVNWNYITILFGWNDNIYGPVYQKDKWLSQTYGGDIGYPVQESQVGASGFATAEQKAACDAYDAANPTYFFDSFVGNIGDNTTETYFGAYNYAIDYLMREYPNAKIMVIAPYISGSDRSHSLKLRNAVHSIADKFGLVCFDFNDLKWWYYSQDYNTTPFPNPDTEDHKWVLPNGVRTRPTIEGYNTYRFCADGTHPSPLGYVWLAEPLGSKLLQS